MRKAFLYFVLPIVTLLVWFGESRSFYCITDKTYITVWKTYNNVCYIIPGKYYGVVKPTDNFIETTNLNSLTVYITQALPNTFIVRPSRHIKIRNNDQKAFCFLDFNTDQEKYFKLLYQPEARKFNQVKSSADYLDIDIEEQYAVNKYGKMQ